VGGDDLDCRQDWLHSQTLRRWCREEASRRTAPAAQATDDKTRLKLLEREVKELRRANEILRRRRRILRWRSSTATANDDGVHRRPSRGPGIEPICRELAIAPSSYHEHARRLADPAKRPARVRSDEEMRGQIKRVHEANSGVYGSRKVWHQLRREGVAIAKCTVERLMRTMGLAGVRRGKKTITTVSNPRTPCPLDKVNREFRVARPNALWVVDLPTVRLERICLECLGERRI
jgi:hypothetical protein